MKKLILLSFLAFITLNLFCQKYSTKNGYIGFYSHTPIEDIKADNNQVASIIDESTGELVFQVLNKSFHFEKALMEEHFNENYMESEQFPKSAFKGKIENWNEVDFAKKGKYNVVVSGDMTMHGVTKPFTTRGTLEVTDDGLIALSEFTVKPEDYGIVIPGIVREKIAQEISVKVNMKYLPIAK